jgi:hypothetical protein
LISGSIVISIVVMLAHCPLSGVNVYVVVPAFVVEIVAGLHFPVIPVVEMAGRAGPMLLWHNGPMAANSGVTGAVISISNVAILAHSPLSGVKVYVAIPEVTVEIVAGLQVPLIPLVEVAGRTGPILFWHNGPMAVNNGVTGGVISISNVVVLAHSPLSGVNVYVDGPAVTVEMVAGLHVPLIPLVEAAGRAGPALFWHNGPMAANNGVTGAVITISKVVVNAHCPDDGVNE